MKGCLKFPSPAHSQVPSPTATPGEFTSTTSSSSGGSSSSFYANSNASTISTSSASTSTSTSHCSHRKCVAFGADGSEEVYTADEWDRTPTEPARRLTYQDLLELKEIQRSLPRANQPQDYFSGRPSRHYLSAVPIGLLPLLADGIDTGVGTDAGAGVGGEGNMMMIQNDLYGDGDTDSSSTSASSSAYSSGAVSPAWGISRSRDVSPCRGVGVGVGRSSSPACSQDTSLNPTTACTTSPWTINFHRQTYEPPPSHGFWSPNPSPSPSPTATAFSPPSTTTTSIPKAPFAHRPYRSGTIVPPKKDATPLDHDHEQRTVNGRHTQSQMHGFPFLPLVEPSLSSSSCSSSEDEHDLASLPSLSDIDEHDHDPPTPSLTHASLDSSSVDASPRSSRASSISPERGGLGIGGDINHNNTMNANNTGVGAGIASVPPYINFKRSDYGGYPNGNVHSMFPRSDDDRGRQMGMGMGGGTKLFPNLPPLRGQVHLRSRGEVVSLERPERPGVGSGSGGEPEGYLKPKATPPMTMSATETTMKKPVPIPSDLSRGFAAPSPFCLDPLATRGVSLASIIGGAGTITKTQKTEKKPREEKKRRNFIVVNDMEIYLDDDDDTDDDVQQEQEKEQQVEDTALSETDACPSSPSTLCMSSSTSTLCGSSSTSTFSTSSSMVSTYTATSPSATATATSNQPQAQKSFSLSTPTSPTSPMSPMSPTMTTLNSNVNLHLPITFKRSVSSPAVAGLGTSSMSLPMPPLTPRPLPKSSDRSNSVSAGYGAGSGGL